MKMVNPKRIVSFQRAVAGAGPTLYLSAAFSEDLRDQDKLFPRNRLLQFVLQNYSWLGHDVPLYATALCPAAIGTDPYETLVALGYEGDVFFKDSPAGRYEEIVYVDPFSSVSKKFNGAKGLTSIGSDLYACGFDGKLFRRSSLNSWSLLTPEFVTNFSALSSASREARKNAGGDWKAGLAVRRSEKWRRDPRKAFNQVIGMSEAEIYITGHEGGLLFWNGQQPRWIEPTPKVSLFGMYVEPPNIWVCGSEGTILHGNYDDGFDDYSLGTDHSFNKIIRFKGKIYISANGGFGGPVGLFTYDGRKLEQVSCGLTPDIHDIHTVTAADGILWAVGYRDILCFDGQTWQRIDHPDNPPVR